MEETRVRSKAKPPSLSASDTRSSSRGSTSGRQTAIKVSETLNQSGHATASTTSTSRTKMTLTTTVHKLTDYSTNGNAPSQVESDDKKKGLRKCGMEDEDEGELFVRDLNGIILQYLESSGLHETYTTFYDELRSSGMLIPDHFSADIDRGISMQDVETLLMHFDQENGDALLEFWEVLTNMVDIEGQGHSDIEKITFYIQVYIALIPFRQKSGDDRKSTSMTKLKEYFQTKSEACTMDKEMLSLFALPFVPDPETHPVFGPLFQAAWIKKLRARIKNLARALCSPNRLMTTDNTDLAKMFRTCTNAIPHEIVSNDGKKVCIMSNTEPVCFTSGAAVSPCSAKSDVDPNVFNPSQLFRRMNELIMENERFKAEESKYEKQCSQLLNISLLLAQSLEEAAQGKEVNMEQLRREVNQCLPISMANKKMNEALNPSAEREPSNSEEESSNESDSSSSNNTLLDNNNSKIPNRGAKHKKI